MKMRTEGKRNREGERMRINKAKDEVEGGQLQRKQKQHQPGRKESRRMLFLPDLRRRVGSLKLV